jgi:hypothetical protein
MKSHFAFLLPAAMLSQAFAQATIETKTAPPPYTVKVGPATVAPSATTTYTNPGNGPSGPIPGNTRGSTTTTHIGGTVTIPIGGAQK